MASESSTRHRHSLASLADPAFCAEPKQTDHLKRAIQLTEQVDKLQAELNQILAGFVSGDGPQPEPPNTKPAKLGRKKGEMSAAGRAAIIVA